MAQKIIVIDDVPDVVEVLTDLFELEDYEVQGFTLPTEALDYLLKEDDYDCVVCDINMPVLNGIELFKKFRQGKEGPIPFVFNSAHAEFLSEVDELIEKYPPTVFINKASTEHVRIINDLLSN